MPAALAVDVQQLGVPLGSLLLSGSAQEIEFTMESRLNGVIQAVAFDSSSNAVAFRYRDTATGTIMIVPAGAGVKLPVYKTQSWWFEQDASSAAPTLRLSCVG